MIFLSSDKVIICPFSIASGNRSICDSRCAWLIKSESGYECAVAVIAKKKTIVPVSQA